MKEKLDKIEFIQEHLREPERLLEEEFMNWLQEEENKHLLEEVTTNRMAFLQKEYGQQIGSRSMRTDGFSGRFVVTTREREKVSFPHGTN